MSTVPQEIYKKSVESVHEYHQLSSELDDAIREIETYVSVLNESQTARLHSLVVHAEGKPAFDASEVDKQYHLLLRIQEQVVDSSGTLRATASIKDMSAVLSAISSLLGLFLKAEAQIDSIKAEADLKQSVLSALETLPEKNKKAFFDRLEELS